MDSSTNMLFQLCSALELVPGGSPKNFGVLQNAARWALANDKFDLKPYQATALKPILGMLKDKQVKEFIPALPLTLAEGQLMPKSVAPTPTELSQQFNLLKTNLSQASSEDQLLATLEVFGSTLAINSQYIDLSLYDFCKITTGIAQCLEKGTKLRLIGGSISGIQSYLYDIVSKNAAKLLKGRSFYLQLLTDSLLDEILTAFQLSPCHVVYASGGGFFVLAPDQAGIEQAFEQLAKKIAKSIYASHKTSLFAELSITRAFDASQAIDTIWKELYDQLELLKFKRLHQNESLLQDFFNDALEVGGLKARDPITNEELTEDDTIDKLFDGTLVLKSTKQQIELGRKLAKAKYWYSSDQSLKKKETVEDPFDNSHGLSENLPQDSTSLRIRGLNNITPKTPFIFYGGNRFPLFTAQDIAKMTKTEDKDNHHVGDVKTFEYLVEGEGLKRLAILRMDVDGLGAIFSDEIKRSTYNLNFTRYAATSRSLDYFFKGYLNTLQAPYQNTSIIIYSGGDDLFIVGRWKEVLQLAETIHLQFGVWTCHNLTLSGGIVLLPAKFPIMQGARLAEEAEKKAKKHQLPNGSEKNALSIFEMPLNWEKEWVIVKKLYQEIYQLLDSKSINKSFISKIQSHASAEQIYRQALQNNEPISPKWRWVMAYDMTRFSKDLKGDAKSFIERITQNTFLNRYNGAKIESNYSFLTLLQIAARWAELDTRTE